MLMDFDGLSTPLVADACVRAGVPLRVAPPGIGAVIPGQRIAGRALPARHYGSVDVFLEAFSGAAHGDVLVIDNGGREDEACIGDLVVLEAQAAGVGAVMVWGLHRDTAELTQIALPVFSYGRCPAGPVRLDEQEPIALASARFGACLVTRDDIAFGDDDGVVFVAASQAGEVLAAARHIGEVERDQALKIQAVRPCASRQPSANTWRGGQPNRPTPSGGTCGGSAVPSRSRRPRRPAATGDSPGLGVTHHVARRSANARRA